MATKVTILGQEQKNSNKKKIEFVKTLSGNLFFCNPEREPSSFENIELICSKYTSLYDLMFAYDEFRTCGVLYLGHFNDGIV